MSLLLLLRGNKETGVSVVVEEPVSKGGVYWKGILSNIWPLEALEEDKPKAKKIRKLAEKVAEVEQEQKEIVLQAIEINPNLFLQLAPEIELQENIEFNNIIELLEALKLQMAERLAQSQLEAMAKAQARIQRQNYIQLMLQIEQARQEAQDREDEELFIMFLHESL